MPPNPYDAAWLAQQLQRPGYGLARGSMAVAQDGAQEARSARDMSQQSRRQGLQNSEPVSGLPAHVTLILSPLKTVNESNGSIGHLRLRMARTKQQRQATYRWLHHWLPTLPAGWAACTVTLTRIAPGILDDDGLQSAMKHIRDGVADWWDSAPGKGDDRQPALTWAYGQRKAKGRYEVEIRLERRER